MYFSGVNILLIVLVEASQLGSSVSGPNVTAYRPPTLDVPETIDIPSGSFLVIVCSGIDELEWELPGLNLDNLHYNITETVRETSEGLKEYKSNLTLTQLVSNDTGRYTCYYEDTEEEDDFAFTDVFVNDPNNLFLPSREYGYEHLLALHEGRRVVLPCPSTYSNLNVTLCKMHEDECESQPDTDVEYDAASGFTIPSVTSYFGGIFGCVATYGNFTQIVKLHLIFLKQTFNPHPYIQHPKASYHMVNGSFSLNCTVNVELSTLVFMRWDYPNKIKNPSRIIEKDSYNEYKRDSYYAYKKVTKELRVTDTQLSDAGKYRCSVIDHGNKSASVEVDIKVYGWSNMTYVNLSTEIDTSKPLEGKIGDKFKVLVSIVAFPYADTVFATWYKDGNEITSDEHYEIQSSSTETSVIINSLQRSDSGKYVLTVRSIGASNSIFVILHVIDEPEVNVTGSQNVYLVNETYVLLCHGNGYPVPISWWKWKKIVPPDDKTIGINSWMQAEVSKYQPNVINETKQEGDGNSFAYLEVTAIESGYYVCSSRSPMGITTKIVHFIVSDAKDGFDVEVSDEMPIVSDRVTITCKASHYYYRNIKLVWRPFLNASSNQVPTNASAIPLHMHRTKYSLTVVKEFHSITLQDSGIYECEGFSRNKNNSHQKTVSLRVREFRKPQISFTNMDGKRQNVLAGEKFEFICNVEGVPFPEIIWYKNDEPLNISGINGFELINTSQKLVINRVIENDDGVYKCEAENRFGIIRTSLTLYVGKASPLKAKKVTTTTEVTIIVVIVVIAIVLFSLAILLMKRICKERKEKKEIEFFSHALIKQGQVEMYNPDLPLADQVELLPYDQKWEFPKERLKLGRTLGQGAFGRVVKAEAIGIEDGEISTTVAVKMLKERVDVHQRKALMAELKILIHLGHHLNILNLLGAVTKNMTKGELMVVVEYCPYGNLRHYLLQKRSTFINQLDSTTGKVDPSICTLPGSPGIENIEKVAAAYESAFTSGIINPNYRNQSIRYADILHRKRSISTSCSSSSKTTEKTLTTQLSVEGEYSNDLVQNGSYSKDSNSLTVKDQPVTTCDLLCFSFQCARGMEYLASRKLIHRDLAARNVLLAEDNVVKICDFGLAKDCYKYSKYVKKGDGPLPIKWMAIESIRDKVFTSKSDVWSFGVLLWEFFTLGGNPYPGIDIDEGFYRRLKDGFRMEKPEYAPTSVYEMMQNCWKSEPNDRPDFTTVAENLGELLHESVRKYYVELNEPYLTMNAELQNNNDYLQMGSEGKTDYVNVNTESPSDILENQTSNPYDNVGAVRPVYNGPVPKAPMEVVPMIQLEPVKKKGNKHSVPAPIPDLLAVSPSFDISNDSDYLNMLSPKDFHKTKPDDNRKELGSLSLNATSLVTC